MDLVIRSLRDTLALHTGSCRCRVPCMCMAVLDVNKSKRGCGSVPVVYLNIKLLTEIVYKSVSLVICSFLKRGSVCSLY